MRAVISSTCRAAWCTSSSKPPTSSRAGLLRRRGQPGRPRVIDDVENGDGTRSAAEHPLRVAVRGPGRNRGDQQLPAAGARAAAEVGQPDGHAEPLGSGQQVRRPGPRSRTATVTPAAPSPRSAASAEQRGGPGAEDQHRPGSGQARRGQRRRRCRARRCCSRAGRPRRRSPCWRRPRRPPAASAASSSGSTARFSGMVSDRPAQSGPHPSSSPGRPRLVALDRLVGPAGQAELAVGGAVQGRRDSECATGEPSTAALIAAGSAGVVLPALIATPWLNCAALVANRVRPVLGSRSRSTAGHHGPGAAHAWMAASPGLSIGPGGSPVWMNVLYGEFTCIWVWVRLIPNLFSA